RIGPGGERGAILPDLVLRRFREAGDEPLVRGEQAVNPAGRAASAGNGGNDLREHVEAVLEPPWDRGCMMRKRSACRMRSIMSSPTRRSASVCCARSRASAAMARARVRRSDTAGLATDDLAAPTDITMEPGWKRPSG